MGFFTVFGVHSTSHVPPPQEFLKRPALNFSSVLRSEALRASRGRGRGNRLPQSDNLDASRMKGRGTHMAQVIPEKITTPVELPRVSRDRLLSTLGESL